MLGVLAPSGGACALDPRNALVFDLFWVLLIYLTLSQRVENTQDRALY
jgi:hypothetical protein